MNESRNGKDGVGMQIANPNLVIKKKTLKEGMNWNPKTPLKKSSKTTISPVLGFGKLSPDGALQP